MKRKLTQVPGSEVHISIVTYAELLYSATRSASSKVNREVINAFAARVNILNWDHAAATAWATTRYTLEKAGHPIGNLDTMIAAHALNRELTIVTNNTRHFNRVSGLEVEN